MACSFETKWSEEEVRAFIEAEDLSYQNIELPYGLSTGGSDRSWTCAKIFPDDMTGKSVLDIGTKYGYFCFEALKRGAERVVGIDVDPDSVRKARMLADCLGAKVEFFELNIEEGEVTEQFDYVLCLNLLHHLKNPIGLLDKIIGICRERLILEVASLSNHDRKKLGISALQKRFLEKTPVIIVDRNGTSGRGSRQKFFMNIQAVENLLLYQRNMFASVDSFPSEFKGRFISIAYKRQIKKLIVIAGPTAVGKSVLMEKLRNDQVPELAHVAGIKQGSPMEALGAKHLVRFHKQKIDTMLFHYDFLRPYLRSAKTHDRDEALDILDTAEDIVILTLWTPPEILREQLEEGEVLPQIKEGRYKKNKRLKKIRRDYGDNQKIYDFYETWFDFCRTISAKQFIVTLRPKLDIRPVDRWPEVAAEAGLEPRTKVSSWNDERGS